MSYSYGSFRTNLKNLDSSYDVQSINYWFSKEYDSGYAWAYSFDYSVFYWNIKTDPSYVRAVLAF